MIDTVRTQTPPVTIRPATAADFDAIETLLRESDLPTVGIRESVCSLLVAEAESRIVGVVGMEACGAYGLLRSTAVAPAWRGHRVARHLVERIIGEAESRGVRALYLLTTTAETYFPSFGFQAAPRAAAPGEIRATSEFTAACPASATLMCLTLPAAPAAAARC